MTIFVRASLASALTFAVFGSLPACAVHATAETAASPAPEQPPPPPPPAAAPPPPVAAQAAPPPPPPAAPAPPLSPVAQAHPAYLHALSDLRSARWDLERRGGDPKMKWDEREAVGSIDRAIADIKRAAIDDGKNLNDRPPVDTAEPRNGRLHRAMTALQAARRDVSEEEDNAFATGLRARGIHNIDEAIRFAEQGIGEADRLLATAAAAPAPQPMAAAPAPRAHPAYLHALSDLRNARWNLERRGGDPQMKWDEREAVGAIDRALNDFKQAAIDDGKNINDRPPVDARELRGGRLHKAIDALRAARKDVSEEEDNAFANGLKARGIHNIDEAIRFAEQGIGEADQSGRK
jgi:tetratricopeptide (TPR) repeat protein